MDNPQLLNHLLLHSNLPKLQSFKTGDNSFSETTLSLSSMITKFDYLIFQIFLNYNHSKQEIGHSMKQQVYLYQVWLSNLIISFSDLPNLQSFITGNYSFKETTSLSLSSMIIKFDYLIFSNLPNFKELGIGDWSFHETASLSLSSMIIKFDYLTFSNLPKLNQISLGYTSFNKTTSISLQSTFKFSISSISRCSFQQRKLFCWSSWKTRLDWR